MKKKRYKSYKSRIYFVKNFIKIFLVLIVLSLIFSLMSFLGACRYFSFRPKVEVKLYFAKYTETEFYLGTETRQIEQNQNLYKKAIEELIKGPQSSELYPTLPSTTKVISVELKDGLAIVNLSKEILTDTSEIPHSSTTEVLAISSIVNTLTEFDEIEKVKIIVEGKDKGKIDGLVIEDFWGHVGIYEEFERNEKIIWKEKAQM